MKDFVIVKIKKRTITDAYNQFRLLKIIGSSVVQKGEPYTKLINEIKSNVSKKQSFWSKIKNFLTIYFF